MLMRSGFSLGRLFGINVRIDWSWLFIFFLVTWNLVSVFTQFHADWSPISRWVLAIVAALLFFLSVLAHELAHSLVARARGLPVRGITLFLFGGVSNIESEPPTPTTEFLMAIVGPLISIVIGFVLLLLGGLSIPQAAGVFTSPGTTLRSLDPLSTMLLWLGSVNVILGLFNLIPGFPLDGGRVLRSILWSITNNLRQATRYAAWVGQIIAWAFILAGIAMAFGVRIPFFGTGLVSGLWLAFIGWFLNTASSQSYQQVVIQDILGAVPVNRIMRSDPPTVPPDITIDELVTERVMQTDDHAFPVLENNRLVGMITLEDVRKIPRSEWDTTTVRSSMTPVDQLATVSREEDAADAFKALSQKDVNQLPVMNGSEFIGLLRRRDILRWLQIHSDTTVG